MAILHWCGREACDIETGCRTTSACLLGNHGQIAFGPDLEKALFSPDASVAEKDECFCKLALLIEERPDEHIRQVQSRARLDGDGLIDQLRPVGLLEVHALQGFFERRG